ncbi:hypothetical protein 101114BS4_007 [Escherichia phage vB_EcoS-101114BS4]|uniref:Uncharacterized protein n=1 Tax=Escherichia phage vB_EcoS-101114BS4 TaxID=2865793 RepID=A0AAE7XVR6_9CAUD|nr:hypothetical protein P9606_gp07 [Escherichia phage vB_EcoS-101114BS4]QZI79067.1 hypothetical protein 101114BS4_007 [Escherichia phage vB_EcoS-101114BS4]
MEPEFFCAIMCRTSATHLINPDWRYDVFLIDGRYYIMDEYGNWAEVYRFSDTMRVWMTIDGFSAAFTDSE